MAAVAPARARSGGRPRAGRRGTRAPSRAAAVRIAPARGRARGARRASRSSSRPAASAARASPTTSSSAPRTRSPHDPLQAIREANRSLRLDSENPDTYYVKAAALARFNQADAARDTLAAGAREGARQLRHVDAARRSRGSPRALRGGPAQLSAGARVESARRRPSKLLARDPRSANKAVGTP